MANQQPMKPQKAMTPLAPAPKSEPRQTLDQKRARHAWDQVEKISKLHPDVQKNIGTQLKKLPTRIITSGLGPALAFLEAKNKGKEKDTDGKFKLLLDALADWIEKLRTLKSGESKQMVWRVIHGDAEFLRYATSECLAYLQWLVRFAEAKGITEDAEKGDTP